MPKKAPTPNQAETFNQPTERISDRQGLRMQSDEIGKQVRKEEEHTEIKTHGDDYRTSLCGAKAHSERALSKH